MEFLNLYVRNSAFLCQASQAGEHRSSWLCIPKETASNKSGSELANLQKQKRMPASKVSAMCDNLSLKRSRTRLLTFNRRCLTIAVRTHTRYRLLAKCTKSKAATSWSTTARDISTGRPRKKVSREKIAISAAAEEAACVHLRSRLININLINICDSTLRNLRIAEVTAHKFGGGDHWSRATGSVLIHLFCYKQTWRFPKIGELNIRFVFFSIFRCLWFPQ